MSVPVWFAGRRQQPFDSALQFQSSNTEAKNSEPTSNIVRVACQQPVSSRRQFVSRPVCLTRSACTHVVNCATDID